MAALSPDDFPQFFNAVHGVDPFPWQSKLARQVIENGKWPSLLDLPTGAGKTATLDIAVFHLACEAERGQERKAPIRILFVIDRRIVVDAAFERARKIADALKGADGGILNTVANRLQCFAGTDAPVLQVTRLRGGMPQERDWARSPVQPLVAISTVDQVGSRLLFRGYGVTRRMWPVHAGLVGSDVLWLLDEVHLSKPFEETLDAIVKGHSPNDRGVIAERHRLAPFAVVRLSATPGSVAEEPFGLSDEDRKHSDLRRRLQSRKLARIETWTDGKAIGAFSKAAKQQLTYLLEKSETTRAGGEKKQQPVDLPAPVYRLAVVVNRVGLARWIFETLREEVGNKAAVVLLTGRVRPLDRDRLMADIKPLLAAPNRERPERPIILVATQTIEAGADIDFDALVTEVAPLDSLRQRFGRLDRLGERGENRAVILSPSSQKPPKGERNDWTPILRLYGDSAYETGKWLGKPGSEIDFGIDVLTPKLKKTAKTQRLEKLIAPREHAPVLLPPYTELWATTSPPPRATPEPALFLHGPAKSADVQIVWRSDIDPNDEKAAQLSLRCCPPSSLEAMSVPIWAAHGWLRTEKDDEDVADVPQSEPQAERQNTVGRSCLRRDDGNWSKTFARDLKPGDTVVVPCSYGGCDRWGWKPSENDKVADLGVEAHYLQRRKGALRITHDTLNNAFAQKTDTDDIVETDETWRDIQRLVEESGNDFDAETVCADLADIGTLPETWQKLLKKMKGCRVEIEFYNETDRARGFVIYTKSTLKPDVLGELNKAGLMDESGNDAVTERDDSWATGVRVELLDHLGRVEDKSRDFAKRAGLDEEMTSLLALAGKMHDLGKADPRFQTDLYGTGALTWLGLLDSLVSPLLAKSDRGGGQRHGQRAAPATFRHEALSVALAQKYPAVMQLSEENRDLVLWLVGTHHGYGRPFFPPCEDSKREATVALEIDGYRLETKACDAPLRLDQGWFERAARLFRRYGPWELARLEAILRLADHAASADEQTAKNPVDISEKII